MFSSSFYMQFTQPSITYAQPRFKFMWASLLPWYELKMACFESTFKARIWSKLKILAKKYVTLRPAPAQFENQHELDVKELDFQGYGANL